MSICAPTFSRFSFLMHFYVFSILSSRLKQNRDRLELYALHKQAVQGDAPHSLAGLENSTPASDQAKYQAWRSKSGMSPQEAMRLYCQEADRQLRVYGNTAALATAVQDAATTAQTSGTSNNNNIPPIRGLAAIPLLCAAAAETRTAYLHRLGAPQVRPWWRRQEVLTAPPGSLWAWPEQVLLMAATLNETISLQSSILAFLPQQVVQSLLWPWHNSFLVLWMGYILVSMAFTAAWQCLTTLLLGSRSTGYTLPNLWNDVVLFLSQTAFSLTESHQPLSARLVGLLVLPLPSIISILHYMCGPSGHVMATGLYCAVLAATWWYWVLVLPFLSLGWMVTAFFVGECFALIELAGV